MVEPIPAYATIYEEGTWSEVSAPLDRVPAFWYEGNGYIFRFDEI
jgi:hypothetical protein